MSGWSAARAGFATWLMLTPVLLVLYLTVPVSPDQALFDYIAWAHLQGDIYYAGMAEQNWPGKMLIHELGLRLFGVHFWTFRAIDFLLMQGISLGAFWFLHRGGMKIAPWVFLVVYPVLYVSSGSWMAGQRDIIAGGLLICAAALSLGRQDRPLRSLLELALAGILVAAAILIRPTFLSYLVGLVLLEWLRFPGEQRLSILKRGLRCLVLIAGFCLPVAVLIAIGVALGVMDDVYQQTILFNTEAYPIGGDRLRLFTDLRTTAIGSWHWITFLAFLGLVIWIWRFGLARGQILILGVTATVLVSFFFQNKGFGYHLGGLLPALVILLAAGIDGLVATRNQHAGRPTGLLLSIMLAGSILLIAAGSAKKMTGFAPNIGALADGRFEPDYQTANRPTWAEIVQITEQIRDDSTPEDFVLQWGRHFEIPYLAERRATLRVSAPALQIMTDAFSGYEDWLAELQRDLVAKRPRYVVIDRTNLADRGTSGIHPHPTASAAERLVLESLVDYVPVATTQHILLLRVPEG